MGYYNLFACFSNCCPNFGFGNFRFPTFGFGNFFTPFFTPITMPFMQPQVMQYSWPQLNQPVINCSFPPVQTSIGCSIYDIPQGSLYNPPSFNKTNTSIFEGRSYTPQILGTIPAGNVYSTQTFSSTTLSAAPAISTPAPATRTVSPPPSSPARTYTGSLSQYNPEKGNRLAEIAMRNAGFVVDRYTKQVTTQIKDPQDFNGGCARYVQTDLAVAGLDDGISRVGSAYLMTNSLRRNRNFAEISNSTPLRDLPAGTIIVYNRGACGYNKKHGHVEIITTDGRAVSDGITDYLYKKPSHIFIPV